MTSTILVHITNEEPILADVEELPDPNSLAVVCTNIRKRDGKDVHYVDRDAIQFYIPWHRIGFLEVIGAEEEEEIVTFVRE